MEIEGKNVCITGATGAIGRALAERAAALGARVHLVLRCEDPALDSALHRLGAAEVRSWVLDLSSPGDIERCVARWRQEGGIPDVLINNAGVAAGGLLEEHSVEQIEQLVAVNFLGLVLLTRLVLPDMLARGSGLVVNHAGLPGYLPQPCGAVYAASKAGVVAFTRGLELELNGTGVSTLILATPGVDTPLYTRVYTQVSDRFDIGCHDLLRPEQLAQHVFLAIAQNRREWWDSALRRLQVRIVRFFPALYDAAVRKRFSRQGVSSSRLFT